MDRHERSPIRGYSSGTTCRCGEERLKQFDVVRYGAALGVVIDSDLLRHDRHVVVIPLIEGFPRADRLNPVLQINEIEAVLATRFIISARRDALDVTDINLDAERDAIIRAIDVLVGGI